MSVTLDFLQLFLAGDHVLEVEDGDMCRIGQECPTVDREEIPALPFASDFGAELRHGHLGAANIRDLRRLHFVCVLKIDYISLIALTKLSMIINRKNN